MKVKDVSDDQWARIYRTVLVYTIITWYVNLYKLIMCDFTSPWKDEIIHFIGLYPAISWFTAWH